MLGLLYYDLVEIDKEVTKNLNVICVSEARSVLAHTLVKPIKPLIISESQSIKDLKSDISSQNIEESIPH